MNTPRYREELYKSMTEMEPAPHQFDLRGGAAAYEQTTHMYDAHEAEVIEKAKKFPKHQRIAKYEYLKELRKAQASAARKRADLRVEPWVITNRNYEDYGWYLGRMSQQLEVQPSYTAPFGELVRGEYIGAGLRDPFAPDTESSSSSSSFDLEQAFRDYHGPGAQNPYSAEN